MSNRIELSKSRAKKLVEAWEGHIEEKGWDTSDCAIKEVCCPIHKYFMELKRKTTEEASKGKR